ncbi:hypothetical protein ACFHYQ_23070 [Sphaerimonospora cavernae]|uniref:Restriction endonuclease n=1 Tax=Sphaerimonospora cavernae TaxID=1740611 RepID=A0ABV6UAG3_9ACTN
MRRAGYVDIVYVEFPDREPFAWRYGHALGADERTAVHRDFVDLVTNASEQNDTRLGRYVLSGSRLLVEFPVTANGSNRQVNRLADRQRLRASLVVTAPARERTWTQAAATEAAGILSEGGLTADPADIHRLLAEGWAGRRPFALNLLSRPKAQAALLALLAALLYLLVRKLVG